MLLFRKGVSWPFSLLMIFEFCAQLFSVYEGNKNDVCALSYLRNWRVSQEQLMHLGMVSL